MTLGEGSSPTKETNTQVLVSMLNEKNKIITSLNRKVEQLSSVINLFKQKIHDGDNIQDLNKAT